jgi:hypothetical protein
LDGGDPIWRLSQVDVRLLIALLPMRRLPVLCRRLEFCDSTKAQTGIRIAL